MFQMMGVFAEFERSMIQERVRAGLSEGQERGQTAWPSPHSRCHRNRCAGCATAQGPSWMRAIAADCDVSLGTVQRVARELAIPFAESARAEAI